MLKFVIDPNGSDCYGKYQLSSIPDRIPNEEVVEVEDLSTFSVVEWRYEAF